MVCIYIFLIDAYTKKYQTLLNACIFSANIYSHDNVKNVFFEYVNSLILFLEFVNNKKKREARIIFSRLLRCCKLDGALRLRIILLFTGRCPGLPPI